MSNERNARPQRARLKTATSRKADSRNRLGTTAAKALAPWRRNGQSPPAPAVLLNLEEKIRELLTIAKEQGHVTREDIEDTFGERPPAPTQLDEIYARLSNLEIAV